MSKNFDSWNERKKIIHATNANRTYKEREIWWCFLGVNIGFEQDGSESDSDRPVLIIKGLSRETCLVIPLTTSGSEHPLRLAIGKVDGKAARAMLSQMRVIDTKRLANKIDILDPTVFEPVRKAAKDLL